MSGAATLVSLRYSPWSERARWVLDHHGVAYRILEHDPFLHELRLRHLAGWPRGRVTVPLLLAGDHRYRSSREIADFADSIGSGPPLIPAALAPAIGEIDSLTERAMNLGRALLVPALLEDTAALDATWPAWLPRPLVRAARPLARFGTRWFARKYALDFRSLEADRQALRSLLDQIRSRLSGREFLFDRFTYADILVATCLQGIEPVAERHWPIEAALRPVWTRADLAHDYRDLLDWRDTIYERHRRASPTS